MNEKQPYQMMLVIHGNVESLMHLQGCIVHEVNRQYADLNVEIEIKKLEIKSL